MSACSGPLPQGDRLLPAMVEVPIPRDPARSPAAEEPRISPPIALSVTEVTVLDYCRYLDVAATSRTRGHPQVLVRQGRHLPRKGQGRRPVAHVAFADAVAYCDWLSEVSGRRVRLPSEWEWEVAARGGFPHARFPWGWGAPDGLAHVAAPGSSSVGRYRPNALGLYDMAGNVFEWCAQTTGDTPYASCVARGGSWAETDPFLLTVDRSTPFPCDYRDGDVGFRILVELQP